MYLPLKLRERTLKYCHLPLLILFPGICDCCDGSDEANNSFLPIHCLNNCEAIKSTYKKEALAQYRHIQAALRTRKLSIEAFREKKIKERRTYDQLLEEKEVYGMRTYVHLYIHTYIHTYIHMNTYTHIHTYIQ